MSAAPVGVTVSPSTSTPTTGKPLRSSSVAGARRGQRPVHGADDAAAERNAREREAFDAEFVNADRRGHNVDDRIGRPDFVEVDVVDGAAMDFGFGFSQAGEDCKARCFDFAVEFGASDQVSDLFPRARRFLFRANDLELRGADRVDGFFCRMELEFERRDFF